VVGAIARLEPIKRFDILLESFALLRSSRPNLRLIIAGDGTLRNTLESTAARVAPGACIFLGHQVDVASLHNALDCFVQSSDSEGISNALLEAMAVETPVVATCVGGTPSVIRNEVDGLLVPRRNALLMHDAIKRTLDDKTATVCRVRNARARVEKEFSFAVRTRKLEIIYEEVVRTRVRGKAIGQIEAL
jgi:glycosyltransferase involved in cell wall biosynthesis